jgi:hypothetical protein
MKATYRITESDYVNAMKLGAKPSPMLIGIFLTIVLTLVLLIIFGPYIIKILAFCVLVGVSIRVVVTRYIVLTIISRRHYRNYKAIHEEFTVELLDEGVRIVSPDRDVKLMWDKILKWRQNEKYILLYLMPKLCHIVPKSIEAGGFNVSLLISQLTQHVGKPW